MVFPASPDKTRWEGVLVCTWLLIADLFLLLWAIRRPVDWIKFAFILTVALTIPLLAYWAYRTWAAFTAEYWVERHAITVRWANEKRVVPLQAIQQIVEGGVADLDGGSRLYWPAPYIRPGRGLGLVTLALAATEPLVECLVLQTGNGALALSPADQAGFLSAVQRRYAADASGIAVAPAMPSESARPLFGVSRAGLYLLGAGLLGVLVLAGVLMVNFPGLPDVLAMQYNSEGIPTLVRSKSTLFLLPVIGFMAWFVNGVGGIFMAARDQLTGAYMLWGGTIVVQICSLLALISVLP